MAAFAALAMCGVLSAGVSAQAAPGDTIAFADANLQACINTALGQATDAPVTEAQAATLPDLNCQNSAITDLDDLQYATNITGLILDQNQISDITPVTNLTNLVSLSMWGNEISDITPVAGLTNLTMLQLDFNNISDIAPVTELTNLTSLTLRSNQVTDITPLAALTNLRELHLDNQLLVADDVVVGVSVEDPLRGVDGSVIPVEDTSYCTDASCAHLAYPTAGTDVAVSWSLPVTIGSAETTFSGVLTRNVLDAAVDPVDPVDPLDPVAPQITTTTLPAGTVSSPYTTTLTATGDAPLTWALTNGVLPSGLNLDTATGIISGTPTAAVVAPLTVSVTNSTGTDTHEFTLTVTSTATPSPTPTTGGGNLATTGSDLTWIWGAGGALLIGAALITAKTYTNRRKTS